MPPFDRNRTWEKLTDQEKTLLADVEALLGKAETTGKDEDGRFGDDSGDDLPKVETAKQRLALIRRAKAELEAQTQAQERAREQQAALKDPGREVKFSGKKNGAESRSPPPRRWRTRPKPT